MIRVSRTVSSWPTASKPGVKMGTICGAKIATIAASAESDSSITLSTVETTRHA